MDFIIAKSKDLGEYMSLTINLEMILIKKPEKIMSII